VKVQNAGAFHFFYAESEAVMADAFPGAGHPTEQTKNKSADGGDITVWQFTAELFIEF
jgi:hypothetical protein